jgi:hypothetical protein
MATLPTFTKTIDNAFTETWYDIKADAIDNVLLATVVWALLKMKGCFVTQVGSDIITETIKYGYNSAAVAVSKGDELGTGEYETETMARWTWRYISTHIQRSLIDDQRNNGKYKIKSYVEKRTREAKEGLQQKFETDLLRTNVTDESGKEIQGLDDMVPPNANKLTGTYGTIARPTAYATDSATGVQTPSTGNTFWGPKYKAFTAPLEVNMLSDMKTLYNSLFNNQVAPDLILTTQALFEIYEEFALDQSQIVKNSGSSYTQLADLGFETLKFKGKDLTWTPNVRASTMKMLTSSTIEVVYDPTVWFDMTEWKPIPTGMDRIAHIVCCMNTKCKELRRNGELY